MNDFRDWLKGLTPDYTHWVGDWVDSKAGASKFYCAVRADGGSRPVVDDRRRRYSVVLLGRREERGDAEKLLADAEGIMLAAIDGPYPCGIANIRANGEPVGPSATTENRAWVKLSFEVTT